MLFNLLLLWPLRKEILPLANDHPQSPGARCLLKGCDQRFHPRQPHQRYCSEECRAAARRWSRWKAQERYRTTPVGREKRSDQSQRDRERVRALTHGSLLRVAAADADARNEVVVFRAFSRKGWRARGSLAADSGDAAENGNLAGSSPIILRSAAIKVKMMLSIINVPCDQFSTLR
jgi:hypothetical protein